MTAAIDHQLKMFISRAEKLFGARDSGFDVTPVEVGAFDDAPIIWYPTKHAGRQMTVRLKREVLQFPHQLRYQLAHEAVHFLSPAPVRAPLIEEGLAVWFSLQVSKPFYVAETSKQMPVNYRRALEFALHFMKRIPLPRLREYRVSNPAFHAWTPEMLVADLGFDTNYATEACTIVDMRI
ncbi:MAG: hypothetical protein KF810_17415 [Rhizobiaceae bacterium]|nr:hypothetical protein [Rhizobiaceae bacterium]